MFGLFGKRNTAQELEDKYTEIATFTVNVLNSGGVGVVNLYGATQMTKEALALIHIKDQEVIKCKTNVVSVFVMMVAGDSAFKDGDNVLARRISDVCREIIKEIISIPGKEYSDLELNMVSNSSEFIQNIYGNR